jgi:hypothetical protein
MQGDDGFQAHLKALFLQVFIGRSSAANVPMHSFGRSVFDVFGDPENVHRALRRIDPSQEQDSKRT